MQISEFSVRRPIFITMVFTVVLVICAMFLPSLQIALYPNVSMPIMAVMVSMDDEVDPEAVEQQVAKVMENRLGSIQNLHTMTTSSSETRAIAILEFNYGTDLDEAEEDVQTVVNRLNSGSTLPDWAGTATLFRFDRRTNSSFMRLYMAGSNDLNELYTIAENDVMPMLQRVEGVSQVSVAGTGSVEYDVNVDPVRLASYGLTLSQVRTALAAENIQQSMGEITQNERNYTISTDSRFRSLDDVRKTRISTLDGVSVTVDDIATVTQGEGTAQERYRDGSRIIQLTISNESDTNSATVAKAVRAALPAINDSLPEGIKVEIQRDDTTMISSTLDEVYASAIEGVLLAALVIFLFLRNIKATIIISLSMPISILVTLMVMSMADITVNSMSMAGLILGIGMIVDASTLNLENTYNFRIQGKSAAASAILGSQDMAAANLGSTLTTICVFLPLIIFKNKLEMIGIMFQDLIYTVCISLAVSLVVAQTLVPALCGSILRLDSRTQKPLRFAPLRKIDGDSNRFEKRLEDVYAKSLQYCLNHRFLIIMVLALTMVYSFGKVGRIGMNLTPRMNTDDSVSMSLTLPAGTNKNATRRELFAMQQKIIEQIPKEAYDEILVNVGTSNTGTIELDMPDITRQTISAGELKNMLRPLLKDNPAATWAFSAGRGPGGGSAITIQVKGRDTQAIAEAVNEIAAIIVTHVPEAVDVSTDLEDGAPRIAMRIDQERAKDLGLTVSQIATTVSYAVSGTTATTISTFDADNSYDLVVKMDEDKLSSIGQLGGLLVTGSNGPVSLDQVATFSVSNGPLSISRENKQRVNKVTAGLADGYSANEVQAKINEALDQYFTAPEGVTVEQNGDMRQLAEYGPTLVLIVILALLLVFAVMAAQFESLVDPFIIFATVPLLMIGVIWIHIWMGQSFSLFSIVGVVALIGVVVNNGIVLVDTINRRVRKHVPVRQACIESARLRLRPILMTTLTTVLGMVPMAFFPGDGAEMMQPIALTFFGGLISGAFLTLYLSPVLYSLFNSRRERKYDDPKTLANQLARFDKERAEQHIKEALQTK